MGTVFYIRTVICFHRYAVLFGPWDRIRGFCPKSERFKAGPFVRIRGPKPRNIRLANRGMQHSGSMSSSTRDNLLKILVYCNNWWPANASDYLWHCPRDIVFMTRLTIDFVQLTVSRSDLTTDMWLVSLTSCTFGQWTITFSQDIIYSI